MQDDDIDDVDSVKDEEEDWMFRTFDKAKLCGKPAANKAALDPFCELESKIGIESR